MTMMSTATPNITPTTEMSVMKETEVRLGRKYRSASANSNGSHFIAAKLRLRENRCKD